jgi:integrase
MPWWNWLDRIADEWGVIANTGLVLNCDSVDIANRPSESLAPWMPPEGQSLQPAERVRVWWEGASRVYPETTKKAWRCDWAVFMAFCEPRKASPLPADPATVASFVDACRLAPKKPATIRRYLSTIALARRVANLANPCADEFVQLEIKGLYNVMSARQKQAKALGWEHIKKFIETAGKGIRADRERALLTVAYDTMARRAELLALDLPRPTRRGGEYRLPGPGDRPTAAELGRCRRRANAIW